MKITNSNPGTPNTYEIADPCPRCASNVQSFCMQYYDIPPSFWGNSVPYAPHITVTFTPCRCRIPGTMLVNYRIMRFDNPASYNKEVLNRAVPDS